MRLPDESESVYFAFRACLESGPVRSIAAAYRSVKGLPESEPVKLPGYFNSWAARYEWQQRAAELMLFRGVPDHIRSDNGPEFTARAVREWLGRVGAKTLYIEPGSPWENGLRVSTGS